MKLLRLAAWTVWFMLGWTALAHAGPVAAAIGGLITWLGSGTILANLALSALLGLGRSLLQMAMRKDRAQPGIRGDLQVGGTNSFSFILGAYATAGTLEYHGSWGRLGKTPNAYLTQVITLSDLMQGGISPFIIVNGERCEIDFEATPVEQGYPVKEYRAGSANSDHLWVKVLDGSQVAADPFLLAKFGSDPERPWTSDMVGAGTTVVLVTSLLTRELFTSVPKLTFSPLALPLYDPRKDTTVGGSGAHRWGQPETYESSDNVAVMIYNIMRGIWYGGELIYGPGIPGTRLPLSSWMAAMNECDIEVPVAYGPGGGVGITEKQFRGGLEIQIADDQPIDVINELLKGCNGRMAEIGGIYKLHVGAPPMPVAWVTDEDFIVTAEQEYDPFPGLEATFNGARATYPEPAAAWQMKDAPERLFPAFEAEDDGRRLLADFQFNAVPFGNQVQRLMMSMVLDGRRFRKHRGTLPPWAFILEPLDVISWTSARNGYVDKSILINAIDDQNNVNQLIAAAETDPSDYDWSPDDELPWSVGPIDPRWPAPVPMAGWAVQASAITDAGGVQRRPAIDVYCAGDMDGVRAVHVQVRNGEDEVVFEGESPYGERLADGLSKIFRLSGQWCLPNQPYTVRGRFLMVAGADGEWSSWLPVTTLDIRLGIEDVYPEELIEELRDFFEDAIGFMGPGLRDLIDEARRLTASFVDQDAGAYRDRKQIRQSINSTFESSKAYADLAIDVATGPGSAIAQALLDLGAEIEGKADSSVVLLLQAQVNDIDGEVTANANAILALESGYGDATANANLRFSTSAGPAGYAARIGLEARTGSGGAYRAASLFIDVPSNVAQPTRVAILTDQFSITNGTATETPFVFQDGAAIMNLTKVNEIVAGLLRGASNNMRIELTNDRILVAD